MELVIHSKQLLLIQGEHSFGIDNNQLVVRRLRSTLRIPKSGSWWVDYILYD
jgi:hypothetical protein